MCKLWSVGGRGDKESKGTSRWDSPFPSPSQPHLPDEQSQGVTGLEQQHLLTTAPSSSSSSLESSTSAGDRKVPLMDHPQATAAEGAQGSQEACAGSRSSGKRREPAGSS